MTRGTDVIGVGPALRKARELRGITLEEVSRDTKLPVEQLRALEGERFDALLGEAHVRASMRTYARYLGLDERKVSRAYARHADDLEPPPPPSKMGRVEKAIAASRIRDNQRFLLIAAVSLFVIALVFGLFSRQHAAPPPAPLDTAAITPQPVNQEVQAVLVATLAVDVTITADGQTEVWHMKQGEQRSVTAIDTLVISIADGGAVELTVDGQDLGRPGTPGKPWVQSFDAAHTVGSPSASITPSASRSKASPAGAGS